MLPRTYKDNKSYEKQNVMSVIYVKLNLMLIKTMEMYLSYTIK